MFKNTYHERIVRLLESKKLKLIQDPKYLRPPIEEMQVPSALYPIPDEMIGHFTLNGEIPILYWHIDDRNFVGAPIHNDIEVYEQVFKCLDAKIFRYYNSEGKAFLSALCSYPMKDAKVIVWGLLGCNCEALAAWAGASEVVVVEYNKPVCDHPKIIVCNHEEFITRQAKADFAISYSSFEHDGLGRYGDPLMPEGDLLAMRQAWESLKDGGILFLGVPLGPDCFVWNAHRIYGKRRLPMLLRGWRLLDVFSVHEEKTPEFPFDMPLGEHNWQCLMVLEKITEPYPDDSYLLKIKENSSDPLLAAPIYNRINRIVFDFKHAK